jgi:hypothetical protein
MNEEEVKKKGLKPLKDTVEGIKKLLAKHEPVLPGSRTPLQISTTAHRGVQELLSEALAHLIELGVPALLEFGIGVSNLNPFLEGC